MAILSPALVVAMCVMFILTRLHRHHYIFEKPFLFGLTYCLEPAREQIEDMAKLSSSTKPPASSTKVKGKTGSARHHTSTVKGKPAMLPLAIRRAKLDEHFFSVEAEFPYHRQLAHLLVICVGYGAAYLFEGSMGCFLPDVLANSRSVYVAVFGICFAVYEGIKISVSMTSPRLLAVLGGLAWITALFLISAGDFESFVRFGEAFASLNNILTTLLTEHLSFATVSAGNFADRSTLLARLLTAASAALVSMSVAAPARFFAKYDYGLHREFREDEGHHREDPYYLGRPTRATILKISSDYILSALTVFLWCGSPRQGGSYGAWRLISIGVCIGLRFVTMRIRLQSYLDGAIEGYRSFWADRGSANIIEAGRRTTVHVVTNSFYLLMIVMAYIAPVVVSLLFVLVAKLDGGVHLGICPARNDEVLQSSHVFAREICGFLAWWSLASYTLFSALSLGYEYVADLLNPATRGRSSNFRQLTRASERRKQKRVIQDGRPK